MCKQLMLALLMCSSVVGLVCAQDQGAEKSAKEIEREHMKAMAQLQRGYGPRCVKTRVGQDGRYYTILTLQKVRNVDAAMAVAKGLYNVKNVVLAFSQFSDEGMVHIGEMPSIERLDIYGTQVTDAGLAHLKEMKNLKRLQCSGLNGITDKGVESLKELTSLENLSLHGTTITDKSLEYLGGLKNLKALDVKATGVTNEAWQAFKATRPDLTENTEAGLVGGGAGVGVGR